GIYGGEATAGAVTSWCRREQGRAIVEAEAKGGAEAYAALAAKAGESPIGSHGLVTLLYFSGERTPLHDPEARGVIAGLSMASTRGDMLRSFLEGTAYGIRHNLEVMRSTGAPVRRVAAVGGGAHNPL